jgi:Ni,Fe-hydrogenase III small subunit
MPEPRLVAALGNCALGHNIIAAPATHAAGLENILPIDIRIPGCPPTPATIAEHLLAGIAATR